MPQAPRRSLEERKIMGRADRATDTAPNIIKLSSLPVPNTIIDNPDKVRLWNFITSDLAKRSLLSESYSQVIELLVNNVYLYNEYLPQLEGTGPVTPRFGKDGDPIIGYDRNPLFDIVMKVESHILKLLEKLGLTPRDIVFLSNPDARIQIEGIVAEQKKVTYFR
jgi:phage terminase small subunit